MYTSAATLLGQPGPQLGPLPQLQLGPLRCLLRGPHLAPQLGLQQGRRREYQCLSFPTSGINRERCPDNNQLEQSTCCHMHLLRKGKGACLLLRRHSVQLWRPPDVNNNSEECKSHSGHVQVHAQIVSTKAPPPWLAPRTGNGMLIDPPSSSDLKSSSLLLEMYFPRLAVHNGMCFFIQPTDCVCPCCVLYTHSRCGQSRQGFDMVRYFFTHQIIKHLTTHRLQAKPNLTKHD